MMRIIRWLIRLPVLVLALPWIAVEIVATIIPWSFDDDEDFRGIKEYFRAWLP